MRVLIIEDNRDLASNMFDFLETKGHVVDAAGDGITGMHLALVNQYDAIVLDLMLPGMDGITLCRKLREDGGKDTPVLMITARDSLDDKIAGLEAGADDYLVKPAELREIELRLRVLLRRSGEHTQKQKKMRWTTSVSIPPPVRCAAATRRLNCRRFPTRYSRRSWRVRRRWSTATISNISCGAKAARIATRCGRMCICSGNSSTSRSRGNCCVRCGVLVTSWSARMFQSNSLRFRVAFYYALFGAGLSIFLSGGSSLAVQQVGHHLMDEALEELDEHVSAAVFSSNRIKSIRGYMLSPTRSRDIPLEIESLSPGSYNMTVGDIDYRVMVVDKYGARYFMLYDTQLQHFHEEVFLRYVVFFALFMIVSSSVGGCWLASRVTASVTRLAKQVGQAQPGDTDLSLPDRTDQQRRSGGAGAGF